MGVFERLKEGLQRTASQFTSRFSEVEVGDGMAGASAQAAVAIKSMDVLEEVLLSADVGVTATERIAAKVREQARAGGSLEALVREQLLTIFAEADRPDHLNGPGPVVVLIVGVNGTGKTTTVGKLAQLYKAAGQAPLVCAADTFRAAAVQQLEVWAKRADVDFVRAVDGRDPASVVHDGIVAGLQRHCSPILVDTAGRLHTRINLMQELDKIRRVAARAVPGAPHEVWLVLDATVGQNGLTQAREFASVAGVTGVVLTKLDGTAKGGVAVAIAHDLKLPIRYVGVGEGIEDLLPFSADDYVEALFTRTW